MSTWNKELGAAAVEFHVAEFVDADQIDARLYLSLGVRWHIGLSQRRVLTVYSRFCRVHHASLRFTFPLIPRRMGLSERQ